MSIFHDQEGYVIALSFCGFRFGGGDLCLGCVFDELYTCFLSTGFFRWHASHSSGYDVMFASWGRATGLFTLFYQMTSDGCCSLELTRV